MKKIAIIFNQPPHGNSLGREALDLALAVSDINQVSVFFAEYGVLHLLPNQQPDKILMRDYISALGMLELYDITHIYVANESLAQFNVIENLLTIDCKIISKLNMANLLIHQDAILRF